VAVSFAQAMNDLKRLTNTFGLSPSTGTSAWVGSKVRTVKDRGNSSRSSWRSSRTLTAVDEFDDHPGFRPVLAAGQEVAVLVGDAFEVAAGDAVADGAVLALFPAGAAAFQMENYWWRDVIPSVRYSSPEMRT
jgi:hypothetical protein